MLVTDWPVFVVILIQHDPSGSFSRVVRLKFSNLLWLLVVFQNFGSIISIEQTTHLVERLAWACYASLERGELLWVVVTLGPIILFWEFIMMKNAHTQDYKLLTTNKRTTHWKTQFREEINCLFFFSILLKMENGRKAVNVDKKENISASLS